MSETQPDPSKTNRLAWLHRQAEKLFVPEALFHGVTGEEVLAHIEEGPHDITFIVPTDPKLRKTARFALIRIPEEDRLFFEALLASDLTDEVPSEDS